MITVGGMPRKKAKTMPVRLDVDLIRKLRMIAGAEGKLLPDLLAEILRPIADKRLEKHIRGISSDRDEAE